MEDKITLSGLTAMLSVRTGDSKRDSEDFIREFFSLIADTLSQGESVKVRGFGMFKLTGVEARKSVNVNTGEEHLIPAHRKVTFIPSKEIAELVNAPFEMFHSVEITEEQAERLSEGEEPVVEPDEESSIEIEELPEETEAVEDSEIIEKSVPVEETEYPGEETDDIPFMQNENISDDTQIYNIYDMPEESGDNTLDEEISRESELPPFAGEKVAEKEEIPEEEVYAEPKEEVSADQKEEVYADQKEEVSEEPEENASGENVIYDTEAIENYESGLKVWKKRLAGRYWIGLVTGITVTLLGVILAWNIWGIRMMKTIEFGRQNIAVADTVAAPVNTVEVKTDAKMENDSALAGVEEEKVEITKEKVEETEVAPTKPSDAKVYDTITTTRYLTTMAKDHYGNYHLWPYIYMENESFLGHPDRIRPGTKVVIPDLKKYGVNPDNPEDIAKAKKLGTQIYSRYTKQ